MCIMEDNCLENEAQGDNSVTSTYVSCHAWLDLRELFCKNKNDYREIGHKDMAKSLPFP